jgi:hypothetical protein
VPLVPGGRRIGSDDEQPLHVDPRVPREDAREAVPEQRRARQQHERQRDLRRDENLAGRPPPPPARARVSGLLEGRHHVAARRGERGQQRGDGGDRDRERHGEPGEAPAGRRVQRERLA